MAKLNHQPYEEWLLSEATLSLEETRRLQEHLEACPACRELSLALRGVEFALRSAGWVAAADGFARRWEKRLEAERRRRQQQQTHWMLAFSLGGTALLLGLTLWLVFPLIRQPLPLLLTWVYRLMVTISLVNAVEEALTTLVPTLLLAVPGLVWIGLAGLLTLLGVLWLATLQRLLATRRIIL